MCNCNSITTTTTNICQEPVSCSCPVLLSSSCINNVDVDLECSNILKGQTLSEVLVLLDEYICTKFDSVTNFFELINVGAGSQVYKGVSMLGKKEMRTLVDSGLINLVQGTNDITISVDEAALNTFIEANQKTYSATNIGTGASVYKDTTVVGDNTQFNIRKIKTSNSGTGEELLKTEVENTNDISIIGKTLKSNSLNITSTADEIFLETPTLSIGALKTFYVNSNYSPTIDSPSDGSIIRPYLTYDEAKTAFIGTGDITTPQYIGSKIILQTSSTTALNPTINELILEFENNVALIYTGTDLYMFDTEILYSLIPKNPTRQDLTKRIKISLTGVGQITRTAGIGLVRGMGSNRTAQAQFGDLSSEVYLGLKSSDIISLFERVSYPSNIWDGDSTNEFGITYESIYGTPHKYSLQLLPTTPLIYTKYNNINNTVARGVNSFGTLNITNLANTSILVDSSDTLFGADTINFDIHTNYIATSSAIKMVDYTNYYYPVTNKNFIQGSGKMFCSKITAGRQDGLRITGVDNFFKFTNNAYFDYGVIDIYSVYYATNFINISDVSNTNTDFNISNTLKGSSINIPGRYFIDTNQATMNILMPNSEISPFLNKSTTVVNIIPNTKGTLSTFFDKPVISGIGNYVDDAAASVAGLITNSLYFNTTNNALDLV